MDRLGPAAGVSSGLRSRIAGRFEGCHVVDIGLRSETRRRAPGPEPLAPSIRSRSAPEPEDSLAWEGIVPETGSANDSPESAQILPSVKLNRVFGHVSRDDLVDMFRVAIAPDTSNVSILLKPAAPTDHLSGQLIVLDEEGRILHNGTLPPDGAGMTVNIQPAKGTSQSSLVVGVLADEPSSDPRVPRLPSHYELQISQEESPEPPTRPRPKRRNLRPIPRPRNPILPPPPPSPTVTPPDTEGSTPPAPDQDAGEIVQGEFHRRATSRAFRGAAGGHPHRFRPAPDAGSDRRRAGRFLLVRLPVAGNDRGLGGRGGGRGSGRISEESASVVVLEGPGGFPVLAAASLASRPPLTDAAAVACLPDLLESIGRASTTAVMASRKDESREGNRPTRRSSIALAVHVAALMATGLLLPDFITLFGDREPRRRRRRLRDGSRRAAGAMPWRERRDEAQPRERSAAIAGRGRRSQVRRPRASTRGSRPGRSARQAA